MILSQTLAAYMQQGVSCHRALEQRSSKVFEMDQISLSEQFLLGRKISRGVTVFGHICVFLQQFFCWKFAHSRKKRINCVSTIDMNTSPTQISENTKTHGRGFANTFSYLMSPTSIISSSSLVMSTTFVMLRRCRISRYNWSSWCSRKN